MDSTVEILGLQAVFLVAKVDECDGVSLGLLMVSTTG